MSTDISIAEDWFNARGWKAFEFQKQAWSAYLKGKSGLLNAPTGSGKTYAVWLGCVMEHLQASHPSAGLQVLWVTPLRALAKDIRQAMQQVCNDLNTGWQVGLRTGDTRQSERQRQKKHIPDCLVTTPESMHILISQKNSEELFKNLKGIIIDEWHELLGNKRGVQVELALSRIRQLTVSPVRIWGISATIGNLEEAVRVLLGHTCNNYEMIRANIKKRVVVNSVLPDTVEKFPWAGHLGINLLPKILPIIEASTSTLLFTNTRSQTESWYRELLQKAPELAGTVAIHHGSLDNRVRQWVEEALHAGKLKLVICTSSLDLGVDFRPVDTVIQVGGPKGVARFFQRAGRSGHQPGAVSKIYFLPTHSLELVEASALKEALEVEKFENRTPLEKPFDVLIQYLVTLAVGPGFYPDTLYPEVKATYAFRNLTPFEWQWVLNFITTGGHTLSAYEEYAKVAVEPDGRYVVKQRRIAMKHRLSIGTIVSDPMLKVKYVNGATIGTVEESFLARLNPGDTFWFAGRSLELVRIREMTVQVRRSTRKKGAIPRWQGGKAPFTSRLSREIRRKLGEASAGKLIGIEMQTIAPLLNKQAQVSMIPNENQLLIEQVKTREGTHIYMYPFEGKYVHEVLAALIAYRISISQPITFSIATNDYGFELLTDHDLVIEDCLESNLFSEENLLEDIYSSMNSTELAQRKFRDIASIAGLIFQGYPGRGVTYKHLQASAGIIFKVLHDYDPDNLLLLQANEEVLTLQFEKSRLTAAMKRIDRQEIMVKKPAKPTPFSFPIMVDRLREKFSTEKLEDRIEKMQLQFDD